MAKKGKKQAEFGYFSRPGAGNDPVWLMQNAETIKRDLQEALDNRRRCEVDVFDSPTHVFGLTAWGDSELLFGIAASVDPRKGQTHYFETPAEAIAFAQGQQV